MTKKCSNDHSTLLGKFCPICGIEIEKELFQCLNGHEMGFKEKFCAQCGALSRSPSNRCSNNHEVLEGAKFCNLCGESIKLNKENTNPEIKIVSNNNGNAQRNNFFGNTTNQPAYLIQNPAATSANFDNQFPSAADSEFKGGSNANRNFFIAGLSGLLLLVLGIVFVGSISAGNSPVMVTVEMTLVDEFDCFDVSWGYADIPGGQVVLEVDGVEYFGSYGAYGTYTGTGCKFTALISDVKSDGINYSIGMASGRRGTIYSSRADLMANDWTFSLSLG